MSVVPCLPAHLCVSPQRPVAGPPTGTRQLVDLCYGPPGAEGLVFPVGVHVSEVLSLVLAGSADAARLCRSWFGSGMSSVAPPGACSAELVAL